MANFHKESLNKTIVLILIATDTPQYELENKKYKSNVYDVVYTNGQNLTQVFDKFKKLFCMQFQLDKWLNPRYVPTKYNNRKYGYFSDADYHYQNRHFE